MTENNPDSGQNSDGEKREESTTEEARRVAEGLLEDSDPEERAMLFRVFSRIDEKGLRSDPELGEVYDVERDRGILTQADREYLVGEKEFEYQQSEINTRRRIRERILEGLRDLELVVNELSEQDEENLRDELDEIERFLGTVPAVRLVYSLVGHDIDQFEDVVSTAIFDAERGRDASSGEVEDVDVTINVSRSPDVDRIYTRFEEGRFLSDAEIGALVRSGEVSADELESLQGRRYVFEKLDEGVDGIVLDSERDE